jgi:hypothetical protein
MSAPLPTPLPAPLHLPGRHALEPAHPSWCDPRRCVRGDIHIGTPTYWPSTVGDLEFSLARYQADGQPEAYLLTLRALATVGTLDLVVSANDLGRFAVVADRLRNADPTGGESSDDA